MQSLLRLDDTSSACCNDVRSKVIEKKLALEARIKLMQAMSASLDRLIADCSNDARPTDRRLRDPGRARRLGNR